MFRGAWGSYEYCHVGFAICGLRVRMAEQNGDGTALNGAQFACCPKSEGKYQTAKNFYTLMDQI